MEANRLGIPVVAVIDSNATPQGVDYPIPGNDDAQRANSLYCELVKGSVMDGLQAEMMAGGGDIGAAAEAPAEPALEAAPEADVVADAAPADAAPAEADAAAVSEDTASA